MKNKSTIIIILILACFHFAWNIKPPGVNNVSVPFRKWLLQEMQLLQTDLTSLEKATTIISQKTAYQAARKHYKHIELFIEYYSSKQVRLYINGPLVPKYEIDLGKQMIAPQGFQRIEEIIYTGKDDNKGLQPEILKLKEQLQLLETYYKTVEITDGTLLEMCQLQLFRIAALGLNGYDATISHSNITESYWSLEGIEKTISFFRSYRKEKQEAGKIFDQVKKQIPEGKKLLLSNKDFNSFNRLNFIKTFINPINKLIVDFHYTTGLAWNKNKKALRLQNGFLFGQESFNPQFFSIYYDDTIHVKEQAAIGKMLFSDRLLSGNNEYSCATCHDPAKAFTDGLSKSIAIDGSNTLNRNAPTLLNVIYQKAFFYDGRAYQLEQQAFDVIHNPAEMKSSLADIVIRLQQNEKYKTLFAKAFVNTIDEHITPYAVQKVLAEYEKTLVSFNSRFDKYLIGDAAVFNKREINGYNLFAGKALCGSCHFMPLFNSTVPPYFNEPEYEVIGTAADKNNKNIDDDEGRYAVTDLEAHKYAFKTPTVRNIELTAPYMHNGIYKTLEEVLEFYHRGGGNGFGFNIPNQTLPFDSLQLSKKEKDDIILFLKTLTDTNSYNK
ncbi:MAG: cytochrome c peroxidase [Ferruginibacter sp.]